MKNLETILSSIAVCSALIVIVLLGTRQMDSFDLGYHLAFGETFFETGTIVDYTPFIYTLPSLDTPAVERPEPGPGNWYDNEGRYRFPNTNWLSQLVMFGFWAFAGITGLNILQITLLVGISACLAVAMRRCRISYPLISMALLLLGVIVNLRPAMRPELFGYLLISVQFMMLTRLTIHTDELKVPSWRWVCGMIFVQLLYVNFHSYFILGLAITGTVLADYLLNFLKVRFVDKGAPAIISRDKKAIFRLCTTLTGMVLACFINPWGWRLVLLPFQTLLFLKKNNIGGGGLKTHPWSFIAELQRPIHANWPASAKDYILLVIIIFAAAVILSQLLILLSGMYRHITDKDNVSASQRRLTVRWAYIFMIAGMMFVGLRVDRNVSIASIIVIPSVVICLNEYMQYFLAEKIERIRFKLLGLGTVVVVFLSVYAGYQVVNGKIGTARFGFGMNNMLLPTGAAEWLNKHAAGARVWCDFDSSSTIHFFTMPHKDVPILTNSWAYPPSVMNTIEHYINMSGGFDYIADKYKIDAVVLHSGGAMSLIQQLKKSPDWDMAHYEGKSFLFLRKKSKNIN